MTSTLEDIEQMLGLKLLEYQQQYLESLPTLPSNPRTCLYYKTGAGKSLTSMAGVKMLGFDQCLVIAPPSTHEAWQELGSRLNMQVETMSHARFRMSGTRISRTVPVIADEMHLFGGQQGKGWKKLDTLAQHLQAPLVLASATPNYNDVERVYCIKHILDPNSCRGGFLQFLYQYCETEQNPFSMQPKVIGFLNGRTAAEMLAEMPQVYYLEDDVIIEVLDIEYDEVLPQELNDYGYDRRRHRMVASQMELQHVKRCYGLVDPDGVAYDFVLDTVTDVMDHKPTLLFAVHTAVIEGMARALDREGLRYAVVTGKTPSTLKEQILQEFRSGRIPFLLGSTTLATGTDGLDRVCDTLIILDDTFDNSLRRQLMGRILPRGINNDATTKRIYRLLPRAS